MKIYPEEAEKLATVLSSRLNMATAPVTLILPDDGFSETSAPGEPMHDSESDRVFISTLKANLKPAVKVIDVKGNFNCDSCQKAIAQAIEELIG